MNRKTDIISRKDIVKIISVVVANWYVFLLLPTLFWAGSFLYTHRIPYTYAAKCQILLKSNETYDYQAQIYRGLGFNSAYSNYEETASQMRVFQSSGLFSKVLDEIPLEVSYYIVGRLKVTEVYKRMPFKVVVDDKSSGFNGTEFFINILSADRFKLNYEYDGEMQQYEYDFGELILDNGLYLRVQKESNLNSMTLKSLSQIHYKFKISSRQSLINAFQGSMSLTNLDYTSIVEVTLKDQIQSRAVEILKSLSEIYVKSTLENKVEINDNTLSYIDIQLDEVVGIINNIELELESYKEDRAVLNLTREEDEFFTRLVDLELQKRQYELQIASLDELTVYLLQDETEEALLPPHMFVSNADPNLTERVKELYELRNEYNDRLNVVTQLSQEAGRLIKRISELKEDIIRYIDAQKSALLNAVGETEDSIELIESSIRRIPKTQRKILNIERRLLVNEELYSFLLSKRAETVISRAAIIPQTKIIEEPRPIGTIYPDKRKINITTAMFGLLLASVIVILKELFFQRVTSLSQLQSLTDLSVLGSIIKLKDFTVTKRIMQGSERGEMVQYFRLLRTNLQYFAPGSGSKSILVTSLLPGEGKTFSCVNLASVLAIAGKKVLIMDLDLHKPRIAQAMELTNKVGVSSVLIGECTPEEAIVQTSIPSLDAITSGPVPPNASELILGDSLAGLFEYARSRYDYVLIDTPPVALISDGLILMSHADIKLFVLNSKTTTRSSLDFIEQTVGSNQLTGCALVLNEEKRRGIDYLYSRLGYGGYGYGYGYGAYGNAEQAEN